jgi:hypothetical protein
VGDDEAAVGSQSHIQQSAPSQIAKLSARDDREALVTKPTFDY